MKAIDYRLVFDVAASSGRWLSVVWPLYLLPAVGLVLVIVPQRVLDRIPMWHPKGTLGKAFAIAFFVLTAFISVFLTYEHYEETKRMLSLEIAGKLQFVEGCLQLFHPMPQSGHDFEEIQVGGKTFAYSDYDESSPAFNNTESHGGPIHADSAVKIWHVGTRIAKLEAADHACPRAPNPRAKATALGLP